MKTTTITLTEQEAQVLVQLLDIAVKAGGLQVAEAATAFVYKLRESNGRSDKLPVTETPVSATATIEE